MRYFDQIQNVMMQSGQLVMRYFRQNVQVSLKSNGSVVTNVDIENEQFLRQELAKIVPDAGFIAEESGCNHEQSDFVWVIDSLDGTRNFIKGIPHFCICVALTFKGEPIVAAIYNPVSCELYYAEKDCGAWLQGTKLSIENRIFENEGILIAAQDYLMRAIKTHPAGQALRKKIYVSGRYSGSMGLDTAYVAAGYIDLVVCDQIGWWDIAAGILLIEQAGGIVSWQGHRADPTKITRFMAGRPWVYQEILTIIDGKSL